VTEGKKKKGGEIKGRETGKGIGSLKKNSGKETKEKIAPYSKQKKTLLETLSEKENPPRRTVGGKRRKGRQPKST